MSSKLVYTNLDEDREEIRLIDLHPGQPDDQICFTLRHASFHIPHHQQRDSLPPKELRKTLPPGWDVFETAPYHYRYLFEDEDGNTSWDHPDPNIDPSLWQPLEELPPPGFQPCFEALSYTWGIQEPPEIVMVDYHHGSTGSSQRSVMHVGANLAAALRVIRHTDQIRTLWIDALCIDQSNLREREKQVTRMADIYHWAQRVIIWLGPSTASTQLAIETLNSIGSERESDARGFLHHSPSSTDPWLAAASLLPLGAEREAVLQLFQCSWFDRLWTFQEITLANSDALVFCGRGQIEWHTFRNASLYLYHEPTFGADAIQERLKSIQFLFRDPRSNKTFLRLRMSRERLCSEPRDHIYGMLSICPEIADLVTPNYDDSVSHHQIFKELFVRFTLRYRRLYLLAQCDQPTENDNHSSWCPDWSRPLHCLNSSFFDSSQFVSKDTEACVEYVHPGLLRVTGIQIGTVTRSFIPLKDRERDVFEQLRSLEPPDLLTATYLPTGCSLFEAFVDSFMLGRHSDRLPGYRSGLPAVSDIQTLYLDLADSPSESSDTQLQPYDEFKHNPLISANIDGRTTFQITGGYFGLGPDQVRESDVVVVLLGLTCPMILRPIQVRDTRLSDTEQAAYTVLGPCYVSGLTDGEAILGPPQPGWQAKMYFADGRRTRGYVNTFSGAKQSDDPRLGNFPKQSWQRSRSAERRAKGHERWYKNVQTGEEINCDPRLTLDALKKRGVPLRTFDLY